MVSYIKNIVSEDECKILLDKCYEEKKRNRYNIDLDIPIVDSGANSYGFGLVKFFDEYVEKLKPVVQNIINDKEIRIENFNAYIREYRNGSHLEKHKDKDSINITISICLQKTNKEWPLYFLIDGNQIGYDIKVGDALVIIDSNKFEHWRDTLVCGENESVVQLYLMYKKDKLKNKKTLF